MTQQLTPPPHLLKKFSEQAREDSKKRGHPGYCKTFAKLCIDWALNSTSMGSGMSLPITPSPELVEQWQKEPGVTAPFSTLPPVVMVTIPSTKLHHIATLAAQWGADQELEACCELLDKFNDGFWCDELRAARRPKPPSLKEINLKHLDAMERDGHYLPEILQDLRRAVEQLND